MRIGSDHIGHERTVDKIVVHFTAFCPKTGDISALVAEIETGAKGVVKENAVRFLVVQTDVKRNHLIQWFLVFVKRVLVGTNSPRACL
jgi:hypothetical protein